MKRILGLAAAAVFVFALIVFTAACGEETCTEVQDTETETAAVVKKEVDMELQKKADTFLEKYLADYAAAFKAQAGSYWKAANSGKKEDFEAYAAADLAMNKLHSDKERFAAIEELLARKDELKPLSARSLEVAALAFKGSLLPKDILEKMSNMGAKIEETFNNFRAKIAGKDYSDNQLLEMIKKETDTPKRQKIWEAFKQVGGAVAPDLVILAKIRNEAALKLGYKNYWDMQIRLQEHNPEELLRIFAELEKLTDPPFQKMKTKMDAELAERFKVKPGEMMPWHYDNPFFQAAPPSAKVDLDEFYKDKKKEEILEMAKKFYWDIGLPIEDIVENSDVYEREGKQQHAFCTSIKMEGDAYAQLNIKPTEVWMDTTLHEMGHGVYCKFTDVGLPFNLRDAAHALTTEAIALLFGALAKNPVWMVTYAGAEEKRVKEVEVVVLEQRRREQLIFARWSLVMFYFEKALYENPGQDLNTLWWDIVERFQMLKRPQGRNAPDWAAKIHFTIAPVYYHNYILGELLAAQLRGLLVKMAKHDGPAYTLDYSKHKEYGDFFKEKIFKPGTTKPWPQFVKNATGETLTAKYFAGEVQSSQ